MKQERLKLCRAIILWIGWFVVATHLAGQPSTITVRGHVMDALGEPLIGAEILIVGTAGGVITDLDGNFTLQADAGASLKVSYIGFQSVVVSVAPTLTVTLQEDAVVLQETVVIGYGKVKKSDATGAVTAIKVDEHNKGLTLSPQDLLTGKVAGVTVTAGGGQPGGAATIRIRGGSSLSAANDPLLVIDGVVMGGKGADGLSNPLSTINPSDIETYTVLKDASATAIYGSRASNGVIIITTKKGHEGKFKLTYTGSVAVSSPRHRLEVMSGEAFRTFINDHPQKTDLMAQALNLYPAVTTDWQDKIMRTAITTDHALSAYGSIGKSVPYRFSFGYTNEDGIIRTSNFERYTGSLSLTPQWFDKHLSVNVNAKGVYIANQFADVGAVGEAVAFDPTKPVYYTPSAGVAGYDPLRKFGGYFTWTTNYHPEGTKMASAGINPLSLLMMRDDHSTIKSLTGNIQADYKLHFLPEVNININAALDTSKSDGQNYVQPNAPSDYQPEVDSTGSDYLYNSTLENRLFEFYMRYAKDFSKSHFDIMGGYSYESHHYKSHHETWDLSRGSELGMVGEDGQQSSFRFGQRTTMDGDPRFTDTAHMLISFYGRMNYHIQNRYLFTFTLRNDATSRFSPKNRWGLFPSLAIGWKLSEEAFMPDNSAFNDLKVRVGWGITGQQEINQGDYPYMTFWRHGKGGAMYPFYGADGTVSWVNVISPSASNPNLKWESTTTYNLGLDYGLLGNRIHGAVDVYLRRTKDLINAEVNMPAGTNFAEYVVSNIGSLENKGVEFSVNAKPVVTPQFVWDIGLNVAYNRTRITQLTYNDNTDSPGKRFDSTGGNGGLQLKIHSVGYAPGSYYVYQQVYDADGKPIEGEYVDRSGEGSISDKDLYRYKSAAPDVLMGFHSKFQIGQFDMGFNGRVSLGNYNYNSTLANSALGISEVFANNVLSNKPVAAVRLGFMSRQRLSDYFIQNASFLKIDNINVGYNIQKLFYKGSTARIYATLQNPIVITAYEGVDPEVEGGVDSHVYPRPLTVLLGMQLNF